ncbi:hypothetical protein HJC10_34685 [Corallococcus exiguus]|uniref:hypothetical protein n=1 Tax=Corallococcus TaxID=83461 RepID=UPI000EB93963|nr:MULTISPECIES: hypothetical protein [Corallococcus]NNB98643.1 hypothetical protein [Corallococcus exiguus]NNC07972.1 hypothetical protein [Corallococcus exiguus]NPC50194.1 hypothetical protein [Corallococcus exiguus]NPC73039.1 hypothetical protein [Corallococcus exiguus]RKH79870.1 hypothetical protein D7X99_23885 [Corallococcus sp. AB032C]
MTLPKKGTRRVRFGETHYDWRIRKKPTYSQLVGATPMLLAIQASEDVPRCVLVVNLRVSRPDNLIYSHQTAITPGQVRDMIRRAIAAGWRPLVAGPQFHFEYSVPMDTPGTLFPEPKPKKTAPPPRGKRTVIRKRNKPVSRRSRIQASP